ncbi:hypothetical protein COX00_03225 [Candidatus Uhrbacteria bacterium CG22_combo_CG10-13_8_21_14_all_47_17]|uniref:Uncharacterized protein n=1 Tax=Candidatus Uhrbacteria bacterium CG22_combo_CG10-13_8_21_14_all_47_17 TaxID=1975041 RepID=A0A2H0BSF9_9BACT|nr:MAG: hypothetical protein COX00_03225 [Candidatus Uhrbacteria bacterium CG22_combo_CG10-13_8_21_14_all_47_17]
MDTKDCATFYQLYEAEVRSGAPINEEVFAFLEEHLHECLACCDWTRAYDQAMTEKLREITGLPRGLAELKTK